MPRDGSGTYVRTDGVRSGSTVFQDQNTAGLSITDTLFDAHAQDMADAITASLAKDGQTTPTANLPMGGFEHTGCGLAAARTSYARADQVQDSKLILLGTVAGTNTITADLSPSITAYASGQMFLGIAVATNTGATTLNVNSVGAKNIVSQSGAALVGGEILSGKPFLVIYNSVDFYLISKANIAANGANGDITSLTATASVAVGKGTATGALDWYASGSDTAALRWTSDNNRNTAFTNSGAGAHNVSLQGALTLAHKSFTNSFQWVSQAATVAEFTCSSADNRYTDFVNPGAGNHYIKMNGSTVATAFTAKHRYEMDPACTAEPGEPIKLVDGKIMHCDLSEDPACLGILTGEVIVVANTDEKETESVTLYASKDDKQGQVIQREINKLSETKRANAKKAIKIKDAKIHVAVSLSEESSLGLPVTDGGALYHVAAGGDTVCEGLPGAKVCDEGGAVKAGDYLATANRKGYLKKYEPVTANDMRKVVAWSPMDVAFTGGKNDAVYVMLMR